MEGKGVREEEEHKMKTGSNINCKDCFLDIGKEEYFS